VTSLSPDQGRTGPVLARPRRGRPARLVRSLREFGWRRERQRVEGLRDIGRGRRAFLLGNGPSLNRLPLAALHDEFVCLANLGLRALGGPLRHADMHVILDTHRYRRFAAEIERLCADHAIAYRFLNMRMRARWRLRGRGARPYFLINNVRKLAPGEPVPDLSGGVVTGSSVLLSAALVLAHMGFDPIAVLGCDLDYEGDGEYFYAGGELDAVHSRDPKVLAKRREIRRVNEEFACIRRHLEKRGRSIVNAGLGGNLTSLPRVDFASLFPAR